jgi:hypothetical protein
LSLFNVPLISQKDEIPFILPNHGFLYLTCDLSVILVNDIPYHLIKKTSYSFALGNEVQKFILKRYLKSTSIFFFNDEDSIFDEDSLLEQSDTNVPHVSDL